VGRQAVHPADAAPLLRAAHDAEPHNDVREWMRRALAGEPLEEPELDGDE
jgi:hypothetical protein